MNIEIAFATRQELLWLEHAERNHHITSTMLERKILQQEIIVVKADNTNVGWLRFGFFWDEIPFLNMLGLEEAFRKRGIGKRLVEYWESQMKKEGHSLVLTSSMSNEEAQHFYRKLGYSEAGSLILPAEPLEIIFMKHLNTERV